MNLFAWFNSDKAALRAYGAKLVSQQDTPQHNAEVTCARQRNPGMIVRTARPTTAVGRQPRFLIVADSCR